MDNSYIFFQTIFFDKKCQIYLNNSFKNQNFIQKGVPKYQNIIRRENII